MITEKELNVSELDFNKLVENFQNFLRNRKNEKGELIFTDFDYEGSNLRTLIEMLSYNTFYMGFYANQVANESFLDSAIKRSSVVSKAKELNYVPRSSTCAKAELKIINTKYSETDYILKDTLFYGRNDEQQTRTTDSMSPRHSKINKDSDHPKQLGKQWPIHASD
jgi:5S rRNA maturation endonuclease (ribonuclease M5)